jgi:pyridoxine kinase
MTVHFSNHTGYGTWRGPALSAGDVAEVVRGIEERGVSTERGIARPYAGENSGSE